MPWRVKARSESGHIRRHPTPKTARGSHAWACAGGRLSCLPIGTSIFIAPHVRCGVHQTSTRTRSGVGLPRAPQAPARHSIGTAKMYDTQVLNAMLSKLLNVEFPEDFFSSYYSVRPCHVKP